MFKLNYETDKEKKKDFEKIANIIRDNHIDILAIQEAFTPNAVDFCKKVGATDLLFGVCTYTPAGTNGKYLGYILNQ